MAESKEGNAAPAGKKDDNSLLVALTVTSIGAAAVIGYVAGQVKMAETAYKQISMLISSTPVAEEKAADESTVALSGEAYGNLMKVCESIQAPEAEAPEDVEAGAGEETPAEEAAAEAAETAAE